MNLAKLIIGGILSIAGIYISLKEIMSGTDWITATVLILLTIGAGYICYQGFKEQKKIKNKRRGITPRRI